jgi:hypothetical protein
MDRIIRLGVISISTQPHSAARYQKLLHKVRNRKKAARVRGDRFGYITFLSREERPRRDGSFIQGLLTTFTQIDIDGDWFNMSTGKLAELQERSTIHIPSNLRPNPVEHHFRFYLKEHLLIFEIGNSGSRLMPTSAKRLFERFLSAPTITEEFGESVVTVMPKADTVSRILRSDKIVKIELRIDVPNPDDGRSAQRKWMERLNRMDAQSAAQEFVSKDDAFVKPDEQLTQAAKIAARSGYVAATVRDSGRSERISTVDTPYIHVHEYSTESQTEDNAFGIACEHIRHDLREE